MKELIYHSKSNEKTIAKGYLTDEVAECRYGIPVLIIECDGKSTAIGWGDIMPSGISGSEFLRMVAAGRPENHAQITELGKIALKRAMKNAEAMGL